jgi:hypothetical protein
MFLVGDAWLPLALRKSEESSYHTILGESYLDSLNEKLANPQVHRKDTGSYHMKLELVQ